MRSRQRVIDHGEVFTPPGIVEAMLDLVKTESERVDSRFLEPACGSGNFLVRVLQRKLAVVQDRYGTSSFELRMHALQAVMSIYGIELLADNVAECRLNLLEVFSNEVGASQGDELFDAAGQVLTENIVHGDALTLLTEAADPKPITFAEWSYLGKGKYQRRDFRFDVLTQTSSYSQEDTLFADLGQHEIFTPVRDHGSLSVADIARGGASDD